MTLPYKERPNMSEQSRDAEAAGRGHEGYDVRLRPLIICGVSLAALAGLSLLAMWLLFGYFAARQMRSQADLHPLLETPQLPPEPRLQVSPQLDARVILSHERAILSSYGWVDRQAGIVRIPIEQAIELLTERGLPARQGQDRESQLGGQAVETAGHSLRVGGGG
jgi:hypothetical protein